MKKLIAVMAFAGVLSVPSVIFADANWYGSLRGGVAFGGGDDTRFADGNSRWGIKGSNELADGLTANYRFEHQFSTENAGLARTGNILGAKTGRLANVGLSGGFGNLSLGTIWSASFNGTGAITDNSMLWGNSHTSYTVGNALSYSNSVGNASFQVDAIMDSARDTGDAVDQVEFGMSIGLGDIGKLAVSYVEKKDTNIMTMVHVEGDSGRPQINAVPAMYTIPDPETPNSKDTIEVMEVSVEVRKTVAAADGEAFDSPLFDTDKDGNLVLMEGQAVNFRNAIVKDENGYFVDADDDMDANQWCSKVDDAECGEVTVYVQRTIGELDGDNTNGGAASLPVTEMYHLPPANADDVKMVAGTGIAAQTAMPYKPASTTSTADIKPGSKSTHIAAEFGIGGVTAYLGHSKTETNGGAIDMGTVAAPNTNKMTGGVVDPDMTTKATDTKVTHAGVRGSVGDGGMNYLVQYRSVDAAGAKSSPFLIHLNKSLGDGATAIIEHANNDDGVSGLTWVGLKVDF